MYKTSSQLKSEVKDSLRGRWKEAVFLNLVPSLIQIATFLFVGLITVAAIAMVAFFVSDSSSSTVINSSDGSVSTSEIFNEDFEDEMDDYVGYSAPMAALNSATSSSFMSPIISLFFTFLTVGIAFTFLDVIRKGNEQSMRFKDAFRLFNGNDFVPILLINVLIYVFKFFWSLLFVIPGIVKGYSYSQSNFIYKDLATHKDVRSMGATSFITESRSLMDGHKGRLFWLDISFIGWYIVGICTFGIGFLWINPYINATKAAFYNDLAKDKYLVDDYEETTIDDGEWTSF